MATIASTPELAVRLRLSVTRTARRLRQQTDDELSPSLNAALATIDRHGPLTPSQLADRERIQRPTATRILARLEEAALVERVSDPGDKRSYLITATTDGCALLRRLRDRKDAYLASRLRTLDADERATLHRATVILERLLEEGGR